ncbi:MAG: hypothetical protein ACRCYY_19130 [Trueperaceae bacterium]
MVLLWLSNSKLKLAYTGDAAKDAEIIAAYAAQLPVQSGEAAQKLLETTLAEVYLLQPLLIQIISSLLH